MRIRIACICGVAAALLVAQLAWAGFPTAFLDDTLSDYGNFLYVYRVIVDANSSWPFGYFQVDALVPDYGLTSPWTVTGPFDAANGSDLDWLKGTFTRVYDPNPSKCQDSAFWRAVGDQEIPPGQSQTFFFKLVVPNTAPAPGWIMTKDGIDGSESRIWDRVPAPIPEPSSAAALAVGGIGLAGWIARRRRH